MEQLPQPCDCQEYGLDDIKCLNSHPRTKYCKLRVKQSKQELKMDDKIIQIPQKVSTEELAEQFKEDIIKATNPILSVLTQAKKAGFEVALGFGPNAFGQYVITQLIIAKHY